MKTATLIQLCTTSPTRRPRGFGLVELLVVISIIGVLVAILLPTLSKARRAANELKCSAQIRQFSHGMLSYAQANRGRLPVLNGPQSPKAWFSKLSPDTGLASPAGADLAPRLLELLHCPQTSENDNRPAEIPNPFGNGNGNHVGNPASDWWSGSATVQWKSDGMQGSYGVNGWLMPRVDSALPQQNFYTNLTTLRSPSEVPLAADANWFVGWPVESESPPQNLKLGNHTPGQDWIGRFCIDRHRGAINVGFGDGSVRRVPLAELWKLKWHPNWQPRDMPTP